MGSGGADYDVAVIGAGIVGLAVAAALARPQRSVLLLERHDGICRETSSRNSEVVHAGLYYEPSSLKARACVRGNELVYERCRRLGIGVSRIGKLVVAAGLDEVPDLEALAARARACGARGVREVTAGELREIEPHVSGACALLSETTGIVDSHGLASSLRAEAEAGGADVALLSEVVGAEPTAGGGYRLAVRAGAAVERATARIVVNAAGLGQPDLSVAAGIDLDAAGYRQYPCKGVWFRVADRHRGRLRHLVYPVVRPGDPFLGVHACLDLAGGLRLGPDLEWVAGPPFDLSVDPGRRRAFWESARRLLPWLEEQDLRPDMAGIRAKLLPGRGFADFVLAEEGARGLPGWITLAGIESPGLTAALALAEMVAGIVGNLG